MLEFTCIILGLALGSLVVWAIYGKRLSESRGELSGMKAAQKTEEDLRKQMREEFESLAGKTLSATNDRFLQLAETKFSAARDQVQSDLEKGHTSFDGLIKPLAEKLEGLNKATSDLEGQRRSAYASLSSRVETLAGTTKDLHTQSASLTTALRGSTHTRGRWGEVTLKRVAEISGMVENCDFYEQEKIESGQCPDMLVRMPEDGCIPVDAKVPLTAYLESCEEGLSKDELKKHLSDHVYAVRQHVRALAKKDYPASIEGAVDFTVMFVHEPVLADACAQAPNLFEEAMKLRVMIVTPVTLMALLRTIEIFWQRDRVAQNAREIQAAAMEFYGRSKTFQDHLSRVGKGLSTAQAAYNGAVGSYEKRVLPAGRKLEELGAVPSAAKRLEAPEIVEAPIRSLEDYDQSAATLKIAE